MKSNWVWNLIAISERWHSYASVEECQSMIAKVRDVAVFVGLIVFVISIASVFG
jgi:hypothetical protein